jgi:hypothetical protein
METVTQLVVSTPGSGSGWPGCALTGAGASQPENSSPVAMVAMIINASSIGLRPAIFNTFSLMLLFCLVSFNRLGMATDRDKASLAAR